jgi:hypothetical protein
MHTNGNVQQRQIYVEWYFTVETEIRNVRFGSVSNFMSSTDYWIMEDFSVSEQYEN